MTDTVSTVPDCTRCAALCCVALHFDKSDYFAHDKPAGLPCQHLKSDGLCKIYEDLSAHGYKGCVQYDCLGAGQRVVQGLFGGKIWQEIPSLLGPMSDAFAVMRRVHDKLQLLELIKAIPLSATQEDERMRLVTALSDDTISLETIEGPVTAELMRSTDEWLQSFRDTVPADLEALAGRQSST